MTKNKSISDYALQTIEDPEGVSMELIDKKNAVLTVISEIEKTKGATKALEFARVVIKDLKSIQE